MIVTADHGNADMVFDLNDNLVSSHTLSKVPFLITRKDVSVKDGKLADIAPTMLSLLGIKILRKMTGNILINKKEEK
jgi:2,3-bisphosphoglycerate-independent phosphoglycerate mutase